MQKVNFTKLLMLAFFMLINLSAFSQTAYKSLNYLYSISGSKTVGGIHNREPNSDPAHWTAQVQVTTGQYPALWSGDFLFQADNIANRGTMINQAKVEWSHGSIINLMWHACSPAKSTPCGWDSNGVLSDMSDAEWTQLITNGTAINNRWKQMMDEVAVYLQDLKNNGVEVLFRPLHEMNQPVFWWAGRPGANGTVKLWQITHDYLRNTKGLTNLIWVWDVQDFGTLSSDLANYNPGSGYFDILALDMYSSDGQGYTTAKYNACLNASGGKPIAIGECQVLPTPSLLSSQPKWAFFMGWSELVFSNNTTAQIQSTYLASNVVMQNEMPGWNNIVTPPPATTNIAYNKPVTTTSNENTTNTGAKAVDANGTTRWSSAYADNQNFVVDLGANYNISRVKIAWEAAYGKNFQIQFSTNNSTWTTIKDIWNNTSTTNDYTGLSGTARYVKMYGINRATAYGFSIYEFEVYGTAASANNEQLEGNLIEGNEQNKVGAYPNPFTDKTTITFNLPVAGHTSVSIFGNLGNRIAELHNGYLEAGNHEFTFNAQHINAGFYTYSVINGGKRITQKLIKH